MPDPFSLQARTRRIACDLQALQQLLDWTNDDGDSEPPCAGFWEGLSEILHDVARDVEIVRRAPFPLSEWHRQSWQQFRDDYDDRPTES